MNEKQIKPVWPAFRKGKETFMKTRKLWSAKAAKWLFVIGLLLFTEFFSTVAEAAVPYPLKKLPIMAYPRQRMVTIYADAALSKQPVTMSGDFLKLRVRKRKKKAFYVEFLDGSGWISVDSLMADTSHKEKEVQVKKAVTAYRRPGGYSMGKVKKKTAVMVVARENGWVQVVYKYNANYWLAWFKEAEYEAAIPKKYRQPVKEEPDEPVEEEPAEEVKVGNCDDFIGLSSQYWVLATAKKKTFVYTKESTSSTRMGSFSKNNCIVVDTSGMEKGTDYTWLKVRMVNGKTGYLLYSYVTLDVLDVKTFGLSTSDEKDKQRIQVCQYGLPYIGTRFVLGGGSLTDGIDCSTFARRAMRNAGVWVDSYALAVDLSNSGKSISRNQLRPGDMVFYYNSWSDQSIGHCAIYVGNGYIINASGHQGSVYPSGGIRFSKIDYRSPTAVKFRNLVGN